jgi:hypothetical protein
VERLTYMTTTNAPDARVQVAPKYFVIQKIAGKKVNTRFVGPQARTAALIYFAAIPSALAVEVNYGKGPAKIR